MNTCTLATGLLVAAGAATLAAADEVRVYIGTYNKAGSRGIHMLVLDTDRATLRSVGVVAETDSPSFLAVHPNRKFLYAVNETGKGVGKVTAFAIEPDGKLTFLNDQPSGGAGPCHVSVDPTGRVVMVANYGGGSVASFPVAPDGGLGPPSSVIKHPKGEGKKEPRGHSINPDPAGKFAIAGDAGIDRLMVYKLDLDKAALVAHEPPFTATEPGTAPRHSAFHPSGKFLFVNNERTCEVSGFAYDAEAGTLKWLQTLSTLPAGVSAKGNSTAETQVHPTGKFVYVSNRGPDNIAVFGFDAASAELRVVGHVPTGGKIPRNFCIDPSGKFLLAANQNSDSVVVFRINAETGLPEPTGNSVSVPAPVCVRFYHVAK